MEIKKNISNKVVRLNKKKIKCPSCKKSSIDPYTPFCSKKCSDIDLMKWLSNEQGINIKSDLQ
tara:strand:- start:103 stop:291 length:189 start_codon:yes stop_codon:yes gene_type:complete